MGKVRVRHLGLEEIEKKQKEAARKRAEKKKKKIKGVGLKGGERMVQVEVDQGQLEKERKARELIEKGDIKKKKKFIKIKHPRGKRYLEAKKKIEQSYQKKGDTSLSIKEAISLLKKISFTRFDQAVELHLNLVKTGLKGEVELPHGTGKKLKIRVVDDQFLEQLAAGRLEPIDFLVTHPSYMPRLAKFAKILGPKRLMPSPKAGTVSDKPEAVVERLKKGLVRWKTESKFPLVHQIVGRLSFKEQALEENVAALIASVGEKNIKEAYIKSTMSPSIKIEISHR